jgi:hypothetical protein
MKRSKAGAFCALSLAAATVAAPAPAWPQERVGVVATAVGPVTVARASMPPEPLKFKDDVFVSDRVTTGDKAITRILLGGKVVVTVRERSTLTITEAPGLSTIDLGSGRIAVAVDRTRMKAGERVDIRTPSAVAGVRGTVLVVESLGDTSTITVLRGLVDVARLDAAGRPVGPITPVGALQTVSVRNSVLPARPETITVDRSKQLSREFTAPLRSIPSTDVVPVHEELRRATALASTAVPAAAPVTDSPARGRKDGEAVLSPLTSLTAPAVASSPTTNSPHYGSSPLNTKSPKRLSTTIR